MKYFGIFLFLTSFTLAQDLFYDSSNYNSYRSFLLSINTNSLKSLDEAAKKYSEIFKPGNYAENDNGAELFFNKYLEVVSQLSDFVNDEKNINAQAIYELDYNYNGTYNQMLKSKGISENDFQFFGKLKKYSLKLDMSEGMFYVNLANDKYFFSIVGNYISDNVKKYYATLINEYCNEAAEDAGLRISTKDLVDRMITWENLYFLNLPTFAKKEAKERFSRYLSFLMLGLDNTPAFTFDKNRLEKDFEIAYKYLLKKYNCSVTAKIFENYLKILKENGYRNTKKVSNFIDSQTNNIDNILQRKK